MAKSKSFEEKMARLEEIVALLERGEAPLEDALALFQEGTALVADCRDKLQQAERQVVQLMQGKDGAPVEETFVSED